MRSRRARTPAARLAVRLALAGSVLTGLALPALVAPGAGWAGRAVAGTASGGRAGGGGAPAAGPATAVAITSVSPSYARPGQKITVTGTFRNTSGVPVSGVTVQLRSSGRVITARDELTEYAAGRGPSDVAEPGALTRISGPVPPGGSVPWTAVLPVSVARMSVFGVYPLAAQATAGAVTLGTSRTFLPFWPAAHGAAAPHADIAWIWPLIGNPDQGPCPGLLNNGLAGSVGSGGRLARLLAAGASAAGQSAKVTWVVDPAILASAQTMARPYQTGTSSSCRPAVSHAASPQATAWLARLRTAVAGQPAVATPYADVDIAALVRQSLDSDVHRAFTDGRAVASRVLRQDLTPAAPAGKPTAAALTTALAWPADGLASYPMLETLAAVDGIRTVVLSTSAMPPVSTLQYTPSAVSATPDGEGGNMRVLLADATLTGILGSVSGPGAAPGSIFAARQMFLAQTAMIAAEAPHLSRAIVVAPPRRWDPPASLAAGVLAATAAAPWLHPVTAGALAADPGQAGQVARQAPDSTGPHLARPALLHKAAAADKNAALVQSLRRKATPRLSRAIASVESSAWRSAFIGRNRARAMLHRVSSYLAAQERGISIVEPGRDTLGGQTGPIPISIDNRLSYPVRVRVRLSVSQDPGGGFAVLSNPGIITVPANNIVTKKVKVRASALGSTTIRVQLLAPDGQPLPGPPVNMTVQATHFGTLALTVLAAALGVFVIASATRAIRRGRASGGGPDGPDGGGEPDGAPQARAAGGPHAAGPDGHEHAHDSDTVSSDRAATRPAGTDLAATEDADDYAPVTGRADRR